MNYYFKFMKPAIYKGPCPIHISQLLTLKICLAKLCLCSKKSATHFSRGTKVKNNQNKSENLLNETKLLRYRFEFEMPIYKWVS